MASIPPDPMQIGVGDVKDPQMPVSDVQPETAPPLPISGQPPQLSIPVAAPSIGEAAPPQFVAPIASPVPRTATPTRALNGTSELAPPVPTKAAPHGAPVRRYLNEKVTGVLLEGMKKLAAEQPEAPLKVLGEYLLQRSEQMENKPVES